MVLAVKVLVVFEAFIAVFEDRTDLFPVPHIGESVIGAFAFTLLSKHIIHQYYH